MEYAVASVDVLAHRIALMKSTTPFDGLTNQGKIFLVFARPYPLKIVSKILIRCRSTTAKLKGSIRLAIYQLLPQ